MRACGASTSTYVPLAQAPGHGSGLRPLREPSRPCEAGTPEHRRPGEVSPRRGPKLHLLPPTALLLASPRGVWASLGPPLPLPSGSQGLGFRLQPSLFTPVPSLLCSPQPLLPLPHKSLAQLILPGIGFPRDLSRHHSCGHPVVLTPQ